MEKLTHFFYGSDCPRTRWLIQKTAKGIGLFGLFLLLCLGQLSAQNTPLGTPATQNPDGTTATAGTPAACAPGFNIYSIDHEDATIGFLAWWFLCHHRFGQQRDNPYYGYRNSQWSRYR